MQNTFRENLLTRNPLIAEIKIAGLNVTPEEMRKDISEK
jgi:hypothetical protein